MILKLDQWLANAIGKEARISHFDVKVYGGPASKMRGKIRTEIASEFSEKFLADADYLLFFKGAGLENEESLEKLSELVQRALGKASANDLTVADFKLIKGKGEAPAPDDGDDDEEGNEEVEEDEEGGIAPIKYAFVKITIA